MTWTWGMVTRWILPAGWAAIIFRMSSLPGSDIPSRFGSLAHFGEYAIFAGLLWVALRRSPVADRAMTALAIASAYALTDELHQAFVPGRMPDPMDWLVDTSGALLAVVLLTIVLRAWSYRKD